MYVSEHSSRDYLSIVDKDHHFTGSEQAEYDSLSADARSYYDDLRWFNNEGHTWAFLIASVTYGMRGH